jgi:putative tricarboxylic transport membrane protein
MRRSNFIASALMIILGVGVFIVSSTFKNSGALISVGPSFYPRLLAGGLIVISLLIARQTLKDQADAEIVFINKRVLAGVVFMALYCTAFESLGFLLSSALLIALLMKAMGASGWKTIALSSLLIPGGIYLVFNGFLNVALPAGSLFEAYLP